MSSAAVVIGALMVNPFQFLGTYANSADPVQKTQKAVSDQGQHCLHTGMMQNTIKVKTFTGSTLKDIDSSKCTGLTK